MRLYFTYWFAATLMGISLPALAQQRNNPFADSLSRRLSFYAAKKKGGTLYAHFDKTIYTKNEKIWFTAYLISEISNKPKSLLSAILINETNRSIALEKKFAMTDGISFGNLPLPDTIPGGNYTILIYDDEILLGKPENIFQQPITIRNTNESSFSASLSLLDTAITLHQAAARALLTTDSKSGNKVADAMVNYYVVNNSGLVFSGKGKTDKSGKYVFAIPNKDLSAANNSLNVEVSHDNEVKLLKLSLPAYTPSPVVSFYPEGGSLSNDLPGTIGWEIKNNNGAPYAGTGVLYKNGTPIDTIKTNANGIGRFTLIPERESAYFVRLPFSVNKDAAFSLPAITNRPVISIPNAITDDTLKVMLKYKGSSNFSAVVHNYRRLFFTIPLSLDSAGMVIKIALTDLPKGIAEITIVDSLQRPCAERLFFAHFNQRSRLSITTDQPIYNTRKKVSMELNLTSQDGEPMNGLVSIACVQANRLSVNKTINIENYLYLNHELGFFPLKENYLDNSDDDKAYLENLLLTKGWRNYSWEELSNAQPADTVSHYDSLEFTGTVAHLNRPLKKPATVLLMKDTAITVLATNASGKFALSNNDLFTPENGKIRLMVNGNNPENYKITLSDPYVNINNVLAGKHSLAIYNDDAVNGASENWQEWERVAALKEVVVRAKKDNSIFGTNKNKNECGDYVCVYGFLDCPLHINDPQNVIPVKNKAYKTYDGSNADGSENFHTTIYYGCEYRKSEQYKIVNGIAYSIQFYPANYEKYDPPEPEFLSTIYWKHLYRIAPGKNTIQFYTGDINGKFEIIVQGITETGVTSGKKAFLIERAKQ